MVAKTPTPTVSSIATATGSPLAAVPSPTVSPGATGEIGPVITYFGMVRPDGCQIGCFVGRCACAATPTPIVGSQGRRVFLAQGGGRGLLSVEGRPGASGLPPGVTLFPRTAAERPDLQILSSRALGDGSREVCDRGPPPPLGTGGGIPAVEGMDFAPGQEVTDAMNDLACRFAVQPRREEACTVDSFGNFDFVAAASTIQFCDQVASVTAFPAGETVLTARLRDVGGNLGPAAQIIVRNGPAGAEDCTSCAARP